MELGNISKPTYGPGLEAPGSSTPGLVTMAHGFLRLVQPNPLPTGGCMAAGAGRGWQGCGGLLGAAWGCRVSVKHEPSCSADCPSSI